MWRLFLVALILLSGCRAQAGSLIDNPQEAQRVDFLVVAGDRFADQLDRLVTHRENQGYAVGIVAVSSIERRFDSIRAFLAHAVQNWTEPAPEFLLLVGDVETVPAVVRAGDYGKFRGEADLATDYDYACPLKEGRPLLHVGRFPCDSPEELALMISKTIDYETALAPGPWQKKLAFITGEARFTPELDAFIERQFTSIVSEGIPLAYDIEVAYANPRSVYCPYPPNFNANALRLLNEGALLWVYVGHGSRRGVDSIRWQGRHYDILEAKHAGKVDVKNGFPVMAVIACSTGHYDGKRDCVGEVFLKRPRGPVAFLGGSRVTQPYANGLLAQALVDQLFGRARTLGEAVTRAKRQVIRHKKSAFSQQADLIAALAQGPEALVPMRHDVVRHYNLLGDPALVLRKPVTSIGLALEGDVVMIEAEVPEVVLTLEHCLEYSAALAGRNGSADSLEEEQQMERYRRANDRVIASWTVRLEGGRAAQGLELPAEPGTYYLKAYADGQVGAIAITIEPSRDR